MKEKVDPMGWGVAGNFHFQLFTFLYYLNYFTMRSYNFKSRKYNESISTETRTYGFFSSLNLDFFFFFLVLPWAKIEKKKVYSEGKWPWDQRPRGPDQAGTELRAWGLGGVFVGIIPLRPLERPGALWIGVLLSSCCPLLVLRHSLVLRNIETMVKWNPISPLSLHSLKITSPIRTESGFSDNREVEAVFQPKLSPEQLLVLH